MNPSTLRGKTVLVLEDEPLIVIDLVALLEEAGARALTAACVSDAVHIAHTSKLSAAILDVDVRGEDCAAVCRQLADQGVPFIFHSGYTHARAIAAWPEVPCVSKPASWEMIVATVAGACDRPIYHHDGYSSKSPRTPAPPTGSRIFSLLPINLCVFAGFIASASLSPVQAAEIKVNGTVTYANAPASPADATKLPDGNTALRFYEKGVIVDKDPASPLNLNAQDCYGLVIIAADGKSGSGSGGCDAVDKDGNRWSMWWVTTDHIDRWGVTHGTGKFAGMTGGGTAKKTILQLDGRSTINYEGTLNLK